MEDRTQDEALKGLPGCGMGLYAIVLLVICLIGLVGMGGAMIALINSEPTEARKLVHGSEVQTWRLQPMRDVGLLELTEVPNAWHDESPRFDGTTACVLNKTGIGRVEDGVKTHLRWDEVVDTSVEKISDYKMTITTVGLDRSVPCSFGPDEGADRFLRMVESEREAQSAEEQEAQPEEG